MTLADTTPDPIPTEYHGLINLLCWYVELLTKEVGERCDHQFQVVRIAAELSSRQFIFEDLDARQIASLLWQVFVDARRFFSMGINVRGNLPRSLLENVYNQVAAGIVQAHLNVPYDQLTGQDSGEASYSQDSKITWGTASRGKPQMFQHIPVSIKTILRGARSKYPSVTIVDWQPMTRHYNMCRSNWAPVDPALITCVSGHVKMPLPAAPLTDEGTWPW